MVEVVLWFGMKTGDVRLKTLAAVVALQHIVSEASRFER